MGVESEVSPAALDSLHNWLIAHGLASESITPVRSSLAAFYKDASTILQKPVWFAITGESPLDEPVTRVHIYLEWPDGIGSRERPNLKLLLDEEFQHISQPIDEIPLSIQLEVIDEIPYNPKEDFLGIHGLTVAEAEGVQLSIQEGYLTGLRNIIHPSDF